MDTPALKKSLGQNFLVNPQICARIARLLWPTAQDKVIEIGPGGGALTDALEASPHKLLLLVEKDEYWSGVRKEKAKPGTIVIKGDALKFPWASLGGEAWKIIGNLPYNVASPLIWNILSQAGNLERAVFMTQREVALRLTANPGSKTYGALTVWVRNYSLPRLELTLAPGAFRPPPKVYSAVVSFLPHPDRPKRPEALKTLLTLCFQKRRKQLGAIFRQANVPSLEDGLEALAIPATERPENLTPEQFCQLSQWLPENMAEKA